MTETGAEIYCSECKRTTFFKELIYNNNVKILFICPVCNVKKKNPPFWLALPINGEVSRFTGKA